MGRQGSLSGPFFRAEGLRLTSLEDRDTYPPASEPTLKELGGDGLTLRRESQVLAWFRANRPGPAAIRIEKKKTFQDSDWQPLRTITLQVTDQSAGSWNRECTRTVASENGGQGQNGLASLALGAPSASVAAVRLD